MIPAPFEYLRPTTLTEALQALGAEDTLPLAGGHSLLPMLKMRLVRPSRLVDVRGVLPRGVSQQCSAITIGAVTTWRELTAADVLRGPLEFVRECASAIGDLQVRNHGTIGGSIAHADPASDFAAVALATDARLRLVSESGVRDAAAEGFLAGPFTTTLQRGELISEIVLPVGSGRSGSAYASIEDTASGYPLAGAAAWAERNGSTLEGCQIALTGVTSSAIRLRTVEAAVVEAGIAVARVATAEALEDVEIINDPRADAGYRRQLAAVVVARALEQAAKRADSGP